MTDNNKDDYEPEDTAAHGADEGDDFVPLDDCDDIELESPTCEFENHARGVVTHGDSDDWPVIEALIADVNSHGEVHATVEEHDKELEVRRGTVYFDFKRGVIRIDTASKFDDLVVPMDRIVDWYKPYEAWE